MEENTLEKGDMTTSRLRTVKFNLTDYATFEYRPKGGGGASHAAVWQGNIPDRTDSKGKVPQVRERHYCLIYVLSTWHYA